jgi:hypothetical protein
MASARRYTMKTNPFINILALTAFSCGAVLLLTGCGTVAGYKHADRTGEGIAEYREEVIHVKSAVDDTLQAMDQIAVTADTDPRKAFEEFTAKLADLDAAAAKAQKRGEDMNAQGRAYFEHWEQQLSELQNPQIKQLAQERKAKLWDAFNSIQTVAEPLKAQFDPWLSDVKDLQKYLSNDLTIEGVDAAKSQFVKTKADGLAVEKSMDALVAELNSIAAALTPATVQSK